MGGWGFLARTKAVSGITGALPVCFLAALVAKLHFAEAELRGGFGRRGTASGKWGCQVELGDERRCLRFILRGFGWIPRGPSLTPRRGKLTARWMILIPWRNELMARRSGPFRGVFSPIPSAIYLFRRRMSIWRGGIGFHQSEIGRFQRGLDRFRRGMSCPRRLPARRREDVFPRQSGSECPRDGGGLRGDFRGFAHFAIDSARAFP